MQNSLEKKEHHLRELLNSYHSLAIAYSGGVDSSYLAAVAHQILGDCCQLILADSPSIPRSELKAAVELAQQRGWNLAVIPTFEYRDKRYQANTDKRCYFCKSELFERMHHYAADNDIEKLAYGAITDDFGDHRPGAQAAAEYKILAPLQDAQLSKNDIRQLSTQLSLPTASKPSFACLASRLPSGEQVTVKKLSQIEQAEELLKELGVYQYRARHHGDLCRIEVDEESFAVVAKQRQQLVINIKALGYRYVTLDLCEYKTGSTSLATEIITVVEKKS
jgi:uncharacterized protein